MQDEPTDPTETGDQKYGTEGPTSAADAEPTPGAEGSLRDDPPGYDDFSYVPPEVMRPLPKPESPSAEGSLRADPPGYDDFSYVPPELRNHYPVAKAEFLPHPPDQQFSFAQYLQNQHNVYGGGMPPPLNANTHYPYHHPGMYPPMLQPRRSMTEGQFWSAWGGEPTYAQEDSADSFCAPYLPRQLPRDEYWRGSYPEGSYGPPPPFPQNIDRRTFYPPPQDNGRPPQTSRNEFQFTEDYPYWSDPVPASMDANDDEIPGGQSWEGDPQFDRSFNDQVPKTEPKSSNTLACRLREAYRDPVWLRVPRLDGKEEVGQENPAAISPPPEAPKKAKSRGRPRDRSPCKCQLEKMARKSGAGKVPLGDLARKRPAKNGGGHDALAKKRKTSSDHPSGISGQKATRPHNSSALTASKKRGEGSPSRLQKNSSAASSTVTRTNTTSTSRGRNSTSLLHDSSHRRRPLQKRSPAFNLSKLLGSKALGLVHHDSSGENQGLAEAEVKKSGTKVKRKAAEDDTCARVRGVAKKRCQNGQPAYPPPIKLSKIIGPRDLIINQGLAKIKMESDYIPPAATVKEEVMDDQHQHQGQDEGPPLLFGFDGVNMAEIIVKQEVEEDGEPCFGDILGEGAEEAQVSNSPHAMLVLEEDLALIKMEPEEGMGGTGNNNADAEFDPSLDSLNL